MRRLKTALAVIAALGLVSVIPAPAQTTLKESDINLDESLRLADRLRASGLNVIMTRTGDDDGPSLAARGRMGGQGDVLVSVHNNSSTNSSAHGTEVYAQVADDTSLGLAERIHDSVVARAGTTARGVKRRAGQNGDYYSILRNSPVPAVLVEGGFLSNRSEAAQLSDPAFRQRVADGIADGVLAQFVTSTPQGPGPPPPMQALGSPLLAAPNGLGAAADGGAMTLSWQPVPLASNYQVWRDGDFIGLPTAASFRDEGVSFGGHHYEVRAVLALGNLTLGQSATTGVDVAMGTVVIDPGHGGSDSGATGEI